MSLILTPGQKPPQKSLRGNVELAQYLTQIGKTFFQVGDLPNAAQAFAFATESYGGAVEAESFLGRIAMRFGKYEEAAAHFHSVVRLIPEEYHTLVNMAIVRNHQERFDESDGFARRAIEAGQKAGCLHDGPYYVLAGNARERDMDAREREILDEALVLFPASSDLRDARSELNLLERRWTEGWLDYEYRRSKRQAFPELDEVPNWDGSSLGSSHIMIFGEQGMGDQVMFSRYLWEVRDRNPGARISLYVRQELVRLFDSLTWEPQRDGGRRILDELLTSDNEMNDRERFPQGFDCWQSIASLPHVLGIGAPPQSRRLIPNQDDIDRLQSLIRGSGALKVGLCWHGNPKHGRDKYRSMRFADIAPLLNCEADFYNLQFDEVAPDPRVRPLGEHLHNASDLAAAVSLMDLVISVDTLTLHLAGALEKPVWLLNSMPFDMRWGRAPQGPEPTWYPQLKVFSQVDRGSWRDPVERCGEALHELTLDYLVKPSVVTMTPKREVLATMPYRYGDISFYRGDRWIGRSLELYGEWSEGEAAMFRQLIKSGALIVEVGANIGALTVPLALAAGAGGYVWAIEPQPAMFDLLDRNTDHLRSTVRNGIKGVVGTFQWAMGAEQKTIQIPKVDYAAMGTVNPGGFEIHADRCIIQGKEITGEMVDVPQRTVDSLNLTRLDFLKIDVEGMEVQVLMGAECTIAQYRPIIYCEDDRPEHSAFLRHWLVQHGYRLYSHKPYLFNKFNHRKYASNVFGNVASHNVLAIPRENFDLNTVTDFLPRIR